MKKLYFLFVLLLIISSGLFAQNYLSPIWKISFTDTSVTNLNKIEPKNWKEVNLLLSWERQDYFWLDGSGCIVNDFTLPDEKTGSKFILSIGLDCDIKGIYVNEKFIGGNLPNQFWTNRGTRKEFILPNDCLVKGKLNRIAIFVSNLSYNGGISCNYCCISPAGEKSNSEVKIDIPVKD